MKSEQQLWEGFLAGDRDDFLKLYEKYYPSLYFLGIKRTHDAGVIKDIIQQLFLYLWEKRVGLTVPQNGKAYVTQSFLRKLNADWLSFERRNTLEVAWSSSYLIDQPGPEELLIQEHTRNHSSELIKALISTLPNRQKELVFMRFYEGLSIDEIVERTGLAHRTVYNKIHEAVKAMKQEIFSNPAKFGSLDQFTFFLALF
ncbi:sigma-70 family RNA polymerase sigma factor [Flavihumibacter sp. CACIAM 22H1]|uniref:RNA polymerase sigma factor n=1 Tax=Flavihumibacter sp. CACIAM 22H1 TaxID=1812911 RepID=UPI0007A8DE45|nr:sigma-70 family RNA polymerase sigma factor [Flavihumibacter sp. CACIAM 22H1]KYP15998.1 MAG: hypothetical protein A1D16_06980 [Flavihumibacter sp. CACIAM 22H1]